MLWTCTSSPAAIIAGGAADRHAELVDLGARRDRLERHLVGQGDRVLGHEPQALDLDRHALGEVGSRDRDVVLIRELNERRHLPPLRERLEKPFRTAPARAPEFAASRGDSGRDLVDFQLPCIDRKTSRGCLSQARPPRMQPGWPHQPALRKAPVEEYRTLWEKQKTNDFKHQSRRDVLKTASAMVAVSSVAGIAGRRAAAADAKLAGGAVASIDQALGQAVEAKTVPGVVAIAATDKGVVYEGAFGKRDIDGGRT